MRYLISILIVMFITLFFLGYSRSIPEQKSDLIASRRWGRWCMTDFNCGHGYCQGYVCQCYRGYITQRIMDVCNYEQRTKLSAFLLSFFLGIFGSDWFFLSRGKTGYIIGGILKLLISLGCLIGWPFIIVKYSKKNPGIVTVVNMVNVLISLTAFLWWLTDWIRILANVFYDGNGAPLQPWRNEYQTKFPYQM
ncbi:unnamed protein product [Adineta ricciae]|uniref:Uncharacterized protein n=1 Tax=Adineta ricciae TaxID=249248 RepID=A0A814USE8_ADIRI|nr:unnamed protein product [Adineta ricciae]CAF1514520.1 unnamed protein product [Adineta ricciae]